MEKGWLKQTSEIAKNVTAIIVLLSMLYTGMVYTGVAPVTQSKANEMIEQAIELNDQKWKDELDKIQSSITNSATNNGAKILTNQQELRQMGNDLSRVDERTGLMLKMLEQLSNK